MEVKKKKKEKREQIQWLNKQREPLGLGRGLISANPFTTNLQKLMEARSSAGGHMPHPGTQGSQSYKKPTLNFREAQVSSLRC